jgi:hypothetical protein
VIEELDESERAAHHHASVVCVLFFLLCLKMSEHLTRSLLLCQFSLGTPVAGVALRTLALARCRTSKAPVIPTAPIILESPMNTTASRTVVVAEEISRVIIRASLEPRTRTTARQGFCKALLVEFLKDEHHSHEDFYFYAVNPCCEMLTRDTV